MDCVSSHNTFETGVRQLAKLEYEKFRKLNHVFTASFGRAFKNIDKENKNDLFMYFDNIYRVWYYSALFKEGFASPSIFADIWIKTDGVSACIPRVKDNDFEFEWKEYTLEKHPFADDLRALAATAEDNASFDRISNELVPEDFKKYSDRFTLSDNSYIAYLLEISLELGTVKKIPSIHIMKYRATAKGLNLDQLDVKTTIEKTIECAAKICCRKFATIFGNAPSLNRALIMRWLNEADMTDEIYADLYDIVGVDILSLWKNERDRRSELDELDRAALSSVYPIGRLIDRYFLTPFGRYLQLIQPIYYTPFNFEKELSYIFQDGMRDDFDNSLAVFCPSSLYRLTSLGKQFITADKKETRFMLTENELETYLLKLMEHYAVPSTTIN